MKGRFVKVKKIGLFLGLGILCFSLTACGKKGGQKEDLTIQDLEQEKEVEASGNRTEVKEDGKDLDKQADNSENAEEQTEVQTASEPEKQQEKELETSGATNGSLTEKNGDYILARPSKNGALSVKGSQLVDEKGQSVQLRGISTHGIAWFPDFVNQDAIMQLSNEFGANLFRIAMYTDENGGYCSGGDQKKLKELVLNGVQYAKEADMYVIVDWHILHDNNPLTHKEEALRFFEEITDELKNEKHVLYEICNEPNSGTGWADVKSYAGEVLPVIRKNAPDAVVLIGTPTWCQEIDKPQNDPVTGYDNIMYTLHFYAATHKEDLRNKMESAIEAGTPVFVSEFGLCDASGNGGNDFVQAQSWIDTMDRLGVSYAVWSLSNKNETSALIASSCQKTSGFAQEDLSESGKWIYDMLRANSDADGGQAVEKDDASKKRNEKNESQDERKQEDSAGESTSDSTNTNTQNQTFGDLEVSAQVTGSWESDGKTFYQYQLSVKNTGSEKVSAWEVSLAFSEDISLSDGWNGEYRQDGKKLIITSKEYNGEIEPGASVTDIGFIISGSAKLSLQ